MTRVRAAVLALALLGGTGLAACGSDQDPGFVPQDTQSTGPATTSHLIGKCPVGGPDSTTPKSGCEGPDGEILYP